MPSSEEFMLRFPLLSGREKSTIVLDESGRSWTLRQSRRELLKPDPVLGRALLRPGTGVRLQLALARLLRQWAHDIERKAEHRLDRASDREARRRRISR